MKVTNEYNDKLQEDEDEVKEEIKDLVHDTHSKIEDTIKNSNKSKIIKKIYS